jgi:hypothetical protein
MTQERHWIDNVADLISGRMHNTFVSLTNRFAELENTMKTQNEQTIINAAQALNDAKAKLDEGIEALKTRLESIPGVDPEDLSEELDMLTGAVEGIGSTADRLTPAAGGTPASGEPGLEPETGGGTVGGPITHESNPQPDPLAGSSGGTDAGVPTAVQQPGTGANDSPVTPVPEDAQAEANPNLPASDTTVPEVEGGLTGAQGTDVTPDNNFEDEDDEDVDPDLEEDEEEDV